MKFFEVSEINDGAMGSIHQILGRHLDFSSLSICFEPSYSRRVHSSLLMQGATISTLIGVTNSDGKRSHGQLFATTERKEHAP